MHPRDATALQVAQRWPRSFALVDGQRLAYVRLGEDAQPIVFLSGAGMDIDSWFKVLPGVAAFGTVIAVDRLGVGKPPSPDRHGGAVPSLPYHAVDAEPDDRHGDPDRADPRRRR